MKRYQTRPGVVMTTVGGQYVLVAGKDAREYCPFRMQINETAALCWRLLVEGADLDTLASALAKEYEIEDMAGLRADVQELVEQLKGYGYLIDV